MGNHPGGGGMVRAGRIKMIESRLRTVGVVLAGGVGQRVGLNTPKQLLKIAGRTILEHTLSVFDGHPDIDEVVVLMTPGSATRCGRSWSVTVSRRSAR